MNYGVLEELGISTEPETWDNHSSLQPHSPPPKHVDLNNYAFKVRSYRHIMCVNIHTYLGLTDVVGTLRPQSISDMCT